MNKRAPPDAPDLRGNARMHTHGVERGFTFPADFTSRQKKSLDGEVGRRRCDVAVGCRFESKSVSTHKSTTRSLTGC